MGPELRYSWSVESATPFARLVAVNHDVYGRDSRGGVVYNRIQCLLNVFAWGSSGTLEVEGGADPKRLVGPGSYPITVNSFFPLWCRASLADGSP